MPLGGAAPEGAVSLLDARTAMVAPAFINAHTHVSDSVTKEIGFGQPFWEVIMPPDGLRHRVLRDTPREVLLAAMRDGLTT